MNKSKFLFLCAMFCSTIAVVSIGSGRRTGPAANDPRANLAVIPDVAARPSLKGPQPVADILTRTHDFGIVDPNRSYQHRFTIRNVGEAPLKLSKEGTTSSALEVKIDPHTILPGKQGEIIVDWDAYPSEQAFTDKATIATSDAQQPTIELKLRGQTLVLLAAEPPFLRAPGIDPGESRRMETVVGSPYWQTFELEVKPSKPSINVVSEPADEETLRKFKIRSGWKLTVTLPNDLPTGAVKEKLKLTARPIGEETGGDQFKIIASAPVERELPIQGNVTSRLTVFGEDLDEFGTIEAGTINAKNGYDGVFTVKIKDPEPGLAIQTIKSNPPEVEATMEPHPTITNPGVYRLRVHIPPSDIAAAHVGRSQGKLSIAFDHPRIKKLDLGVEFVVLNSPR